MRKLVATAKEFGLIIGELDPEAARVRDEVLHGQLERGEAETIRQRYVPDLDGGIIDRDPGALASGTLFVQPKVTDTSGGEILLDDLLRFRFLIATGTAHAQAWLTSESLALWRRLGGERIVIAESAHEQSNERPAEDLRHVVQADALFPAWMSQQGCAAAVVRPDRYVFGAANDATELNRLVAEVGRQVLGI